MLTKFFTKPLEIRIGEQKFKFCSVADFEFSMAGRTAVPSKKITEMVKFTTGQLKKEAKTIKHIEKLFVSILSNSIEDTSSIHRTLRELDPLIFSQDHNWRDVINGLNSGDETLNAFRLIALVKYMQYLSSRQEIIKYLYSEKKKMLKEIEKEETLHDGDAPKGVVDVPAPVSGENHEPVQRLARMPKGEVITTTLTPGAEVALRLSKHLCRIIMEADKVMFVDQTDHQYALNKGRNIIGRDAVSTVMLDPSLRDISRLHLVIENLNNSTLRLIDMSSHGTFIPKKYIEHHSNW